MNGNATPSGSTPSKRSTIQIPEHQFDPSVLPVFDSSALQGSDPSICIDNGSSSWRAGFSGTSSPYIDRSNIVSRYRERKFGRNLLLFGKDVDADANSRSSVRSMFDGDLLVHGDILECALDYTFLTLGITGDRVNHPIVMTERLANPLFTRAMTSELLFELYGAPSVTYGLDSLFAFSRQHHADGLSISLGHNSTTVIPVVGGKGILSRAKRIPFGGLQASELMLRLVQLKYPSFPVKVTSTQATFMARETCYFATDYETELATMGTPAGLSAATQVFQFPYSQPEVVEKSEADLAAQLERRKEHGRRLQEMQAKQRLEKMAEKAAALEFYRGILLQRALLPANEFLDRILSETDFESEAELEQWVKKAEADLKRKAKKDAGEDVEMEEDPTFPLVDRPDEELTEEEIREKRRQRLMKAGWEARVKAREEKQREKERQEEKAKLEEEERLGDPEGWARRMRVEQEALIQRMEDRKKQKTQRKDRKSVAAQNRMKTIANLAAEDKVSKKRKKGDDDDGFGKDDADWMVYREVGGDDDSEAEEEDLNQLQSVEARLLQHDSTFTEDDTMLGRAQVKNALINAFVRGGGTERFNADDLKQNYQLHLNVERIRVPESWFQPGMFGVDSAGVGEVAGWVLNGFDEEERKRLMQCIYVTGGSSLIPNLGPRLRAALTPVLPFRAPLKIVTSLDGDPKLDAWRGMSAWCGTEEARNARVTRAEYDEHGGEWIKEYAWSNPAKKPKPASVAVATGAAFDKIHPLFNDDSADLRITSADGIVFCVQSFHLMSGSVVFRDMLQANKPLDPQSKEPIPIPGNSVVIADFLTLFYNLSRPGSGAYDLVTILELTGLLHQFDCPGLRNHFVVRLMQELDFGQLTAWDTFVAASHLDSYPLAKKALERMDAVDTDPTYRKITLAELKTLEPRYAYRLLLAIVTATVPKYYNSVSMVEAFKP